ncbi:hypothetical protein M2399_000667 [Pseudomonas sp. BIGb0450]|nr:hypothetical protein [Pseudomonas sp. BIGb0558]MCS3435247.1 hypothetical protein [Pseudomonas sp. BIGb0450]
MRQNHGAQCRSELAREKRKDTALIQDAGVIVDALREQARSYRFCITVFPAATAAAPG